MIYLKTAIVIVGVAWLVFLLQKDQPEPIPLPSLGLIPVKSGDWVGVGRVTIWQRDDGTCWWESVNGLWERDRSWCSE